MAHSTKPLLHNNLRHRTRAGSIIALKGIVGHFCPSEALVSYPLTAGDPFAGGALYVNKIWDHVIYRVDLETGAYGIVTGNGRAGYDDGPTGTATIEEPNGIATNAAQDVVYFNTHRGAMGDGRGLVILRRLVLPQ